MSKYNKEELKILIFKHVEIAHIKPVSEFDGDSTIADINSLKNLIYLCPNHHWEFDNNIIKL